MSDRPLDEPDPRAAEHAEEESEALEVAASTAPGSSSLLGAALLGSGATVVVGILGVARTKVLAVGLEPSGLGRYGQILTLLTALSAASGLGLGLGTTRAVAERRTRGDREGLRSALEVSFAVPLAVATVLALLVAALSGLLASLLLDDDRALLVVLAALAIPVIAVQGPVIHALQGFRDVAGVQAANVFFGVVLSIASIVGVLVAGLDGAVLALALGNLAYLGALAWRIRAMLRRAGVRLALAAGLRPSRLRDPVIRTMLGVGFASLLVGLIAGLGELAVRTIVLRDDGADAAGIFQALQLISLQLIGVIVTSLVFLSFTTISEAHTSGDRERVRRILEDSLRLSLLLVLPLVLALALFRDEVIQLFLSSGFAEAADLLSLQLVGDILRTGAFALGAALVPIGMTRPWTAVTAAAVAVYVGLAAVLVPDRGLDGAIVAYVVQWGVALTLTAALLIRRGLFEIGPIGIRTIGFAALIAVLMVSVAPPWPLAVVVLAVVTAALAALCTTGAERAAFSTRAAAAARAIAARRR